MIWLLCGSYIRKGPYQLAVAAIKKQATALSGIFFSPYSSKNDWLLAELLPLGGESAVLLASLSFFKTYHYNLNDQT